ncbi:Protein of unknown function [Gryllus bimaculatus]|nr:Protein of unknown function [Gryllus bimaculatus]
MPRLVFSPLALSPIETNCRVHPRTGSLLPRCDAQAEGPTSLRLL